MCLPSLMKELGDIEDLSQAQFVYEFTKQAMTERTEEEVKSEAKDTVKYEWESEVHVEVLVIIDDEKGEFVSGMDPPLPGKSFTPHCG